MEKETLDRIFTPEPPRALWRYARIFPSRGFLDDPRFAMLSLSARGAYFTCWLLASHCGRTGHGRLLHPDGSPITWTGLTGFVRPGGRRDRSGLRKAVRELVDGGWLQILEGEVLRVPLWEVHQQQGTLRDAWMTGRKPRQVAPRGDHRPQKVP